MYYIFDFFEKKSDIVIIIIMLISVIIQIITFLKTCVFKKSDLQ